jgi:hypothetical protein
VHAGAEPPHEEQPGADRRARRRQDRHRRGPRPAHRRRRRARRGCATSAPRARHRRAARGREVPRRVRGAAQGRAQGDHRAEGRDHPVHRRAAHDRRGRAAEGAMDAGNMLKPMLARGELRCIGATTLDEYRKHIEKDAALERRFQPVWSIEPTVEDTIAILRGLKERYEVHHGVRIRTRRSSPRPAEPPLHHRPLPARQGDRPDRRGGEPLRIEIDSMPRSSTSRAPHHAAGDRARGAAQGERRGASGARLERSRASWPT